MVLPLLFLLLLLPRRLRTRFKYQLSPRQAGTSRLRSGQRAKQLGSAEDNWLVLRLATFEPDPLALVDVLPLANACPPARARSSG